MAGIGGKLRLPLERGLQASQHLIKGRGQLAKFIFTLQVQAPTQISRVDLLSGARNHLHWPQCFASQPVPTNGGNKQSHKTVKEPDLPELNAWMMFQANHENSNTRILVEKRCNDDVVCRIRVP